MASWAPVGIILAVDFWSVCALLWELFGRKMLCANNSREDGLHVTHRESEALRNWINKIQGWREIGSHTVPGSGNWTVRLSHDVWVEEMRGASAMEGNGVAWKVHIERWLSCLQIRGYPTVGGSRVKWVGYGWSQETHIQIIVLLSACYLLWGKNSYVEDHSQYLRMWLDLEMGSLKR